MDVNINTLRPRQNGRHIDAILFIMLWYEASFILMQIKLKSDQGPDY